MLGVLRDVPGQPMVMMRCRERDAERLSLFPSLDYKGLYSTLLQFLDLVHLFQVCFFTIIILYQFEKNGILFPKIVLIFYEKLFCYLFTVLFIFIIFQNGLYDFGKAFLTTLVSLVPFLERELIDTLPYVVASTLINFPSSLVEDVVDVLCWNLLPFAITNVNHPRFHRVIQTK